MVTTSEMPVTEKKVEVTVIRLKVTLLKVSHPHGYHLVAGGRLLLDETDGVKTPHPDLPAYEMDNFPMPLIEWTGDEGQPVRVEQVKGDKVRRIGPVRACTFLFTPIATEVVKAWLQRGGSE